jgi:hypothetical protein
MSYEGVSCVMRTDEIVVSQASGSGDSLSLLRDNFRLQSRSGVHTSIFTSDLSAMRRLMLLHGIANHSENLRRCRRILIDHLVSAGCIDESEDQRTRGDACRCIAHTCTSSNTMKYEIYTILSSVSSSDLPTDCLLQIAHSMSISFHPKDSDVRFNVQQKYAKEAMILRDMPSDSIPLHQYFDNFDRLNLSQLHNRCMSHGITVPSRSTKDKARRLIVDHLASSGHQENSEILIKLCKA